MKYNQQISNSKFYTNTYEQSFFFEEDTIITKFTNSPPNTSACRSQNPCLFLIHSICILPYVASPNELATILFHINPEQQSLFILLFMNIIVLLLIAFVARAAIIQIPHCLDVTGDMICQQCAQGYWVVRGQCQVADPYCQKHDTYYGQCRICQQGYYLYSFGRRVQCLQDQEIHYCEAQWKSGDEYGCEICYDGYYRTEDLRCASIQTNCMEVDRITKECQICATGYILDENNQCIQGEQEMSIPNCAVVEQGICQQCVEGYFLNKKLICKQIARRCLIFDHEKLQCMKCVTGFLPDAKRCKRLSAYDQLQEFGMDVFCKITDSEQNCVECFDRYFLKRGKCEAVSIDCKTYKQRNGKCLSCYKGWMLNQEIGQCFKLPENL